MSHTKNDSMSDFLAGRVCLVTGGAGFIGSHLCQRLLRAKASVVVFDFAAKTDRTLLTHLGITDRVEYVQGDVRSRRDLERLSGRRFDFAFHLAAQPISGLSNIQPQATIEVNADGTREVCNMLSKSGSPVVVLASSACAYGIPPAAASPLKENDALHKGFYAYTESKQKAEQEFRASHGIRGVIGRFVNVYGPGDRHFSRIIPKTVRQLLRNEPLSLSRGDGSTVLDFLYVHEAVEAFVHLAKYGFTQEPTMEVFNFGIGTENAISMRNLIAKLSSVYDGQSRPFLPTIPTTEPPTVKFLDSTKAQTVLDWRPRVLLDAGVKKTIHWYLRNINSVAHLEDGEYPPLANRGIGISEFAHYLTSHPSLPAGNRETQHTEPVLY